MLLPMVTMASSHDEGSGFTFYKDVLRDIYYSEELKIESKRCTQIRKTIDALCTEENFAFSTLYSMISKDIDQEKKELDVKRNLFQVSYMYQAERLPVLLQRLGKEEEGSINDSILWQVSRPSLISVLWKHISLVHPPL